MDYLALGIALLALGLAFFAVLRASAAITGTEDAGSSARRYASNVEEELKAEVSVLRSLLKRVARGEEVTDEMIDDGILWQDVDTETAKGMVERGEVALLDVRTEHEIAAGIIPGAQLLPMDEVEERKREIPTDKPVLVYCAGGGRSASVCEFLSQSGHERLLNLTGGFGAWDGPSEKPTA